MTYYAVFFQDDGWTCSLFYDVSVYTQEQSEAEAIETTRAGLFNALKENAAPSPLSRAQVEERARQEEKEGNLPKGWRVVDFEV